MAFEEFTQKNTYRSSCHVPMIRITKSKVMYFNSACYRHLKDYNYVILLYDKQNQKMGIKPTSQPLSHSFLLAMTSAKTTSICASTFFNYHNELLKLNFDKSRKYSVQWNEAEKLLEIQF